MADAITDENFGAWVLKCNPKVFDLEAFMADGENIIEDWSVQNNYRSARMRPADPVVLWVTGSADAGLTPGVWGVGHVTAPVNVELISEDDEESADGHDAAGDDSADVRYWLDEEVWARARYFVTVELPLFETPLPRDRVQAEPVLAGMELLRMPGMGNPSWLTEDEWAALQHLLGDSALALADPLSVAEWNREAERQQPDPLTRLLIEHIAIDEVWGFLESEGWQVDDVQGDNLGWDLTAHRNGVVRCIEVKGRGLQSSTVQLSANEVRAACEQEGWELAVVADALNSPIVSWHSAQAVTAVATPITYRAVLD